MDKGQPGFPISERLSDLLFVAMEYAVQVRMGGKENLIPGVFIDTHSDRAVSHFVDEDLYEGAQMAREYVRRGIDSSDAPFDRAALFWDGWVTLVDEREDAVLIEAHERGAQYGWLVGQRYRSRRFRNPEPIHNPFSLGEVAPLIGALRS